MQIHELPAQSTAADADVLAVDNGASTQKITAQNFKKYAIGSTDISAIGSTVTAAISALKEGSYTSSNQTITFPSAYVSSGTITIRKKGSMAMIHGSSVVVSASIPSGTLLYTLPDGYKPYHETYISTSSFNTFIRIVNGGAIYAATTISTGTYFFDGNWIHQ